ncbi:hypothetical protein ACP70R_001366 [Stipagrostis hirtigluma subsp. patula]
MAPPSRPPTPTAAAAATAAGARAAASSSRIDSPSLKAALAMALIHYNRLPGKAAAGAAAGTSSPPLLHWKRKVAFPQRRVHPAQNPNPRLSLSRSDPSRRPRTGSARSSASARSSRSSKEMEPPVASCRCHFFEGCGDLPPQPGVDGGEHWVDEVLRRRFLRLVSEVGAELSSLIGGVSKTSVSEVDAELSVNFNSEDDMQQLSMSIDFLVELSDGIFSKREAGPKFATFSHQAVDFILASLKNILSSEREKELVEEIIDGLVSRLMKRMCTIPENAGISDSGSVDCSDAQFSVQHLFRKLGKEEFIGQRIILAVSQKISNISERLLLIDPFDDAFPDMHDNIFIMIQLIEFLISDYVKDWICCEHFDKRLFEECARSILKARRDLQVLENMNGLYVVYIERVVGRLAREVAPAAHQGKLDLEVFSKLLS